MIGGSASDAEASPPLRLARPGDLPALLGLAGDGRPPASLGREADWPEPVRRLAAWIAAESCWVAERGGAPVGYGVLHHHFFGRGFIELVLVGGALRRQGIGRQIVRQLAERCLTPTLWTSTNLSNRPMQALLHGEGFVGRGFIEGLDAGDPELVYSRTLQT
jgi:GNAT superfamily N-acetyltransferase